MAIFRDIKRTWARSIFPHPETLRNLELDLVENLEGTSSSRSSLTPWRNLKLCTEFPLESGGWLRRGYVVFLLNYPDVLLCAICKAASPVVDALFVLMGLTSYYWRLLDGGKQSILMNFARGGVFVRGMHFERWICFFDKSNVIEFGHIGVNVGVIPEDPNWIGFWGGIVKPIVHEVLNKLFLGFGSNVPLNYQKTDKLRCSLNKKKL